MDCAQHSPLSDASNVNEQLAQLKRMLQQNHALCLTEICERDAVETRLIQEQQERNAIVHELHRECRHLQAALRKQDAKLKTVHAEALHLRQRLAELGHDAATGATQTTSFDLICTEVAAATPAPSPAPRVGF